MNSKKSTWHLLLLRLLVRGLRGGHGGGGLPAQRQEGAQLRGSCLQRRRQRCQLRQQRRRRLARTGGQQLQPHGQRCSLRM